MPDTIPQILQPYLSDRPAGSLLLLTSVLNAPANWLVARCISTALRTDQRTLLSRGKGVTQHDVSRRVVLLSIARPLSLWIEIGKKAGVDVPGLLAKRRLLYVDGLDCYGKDAPLDAPGPTYSLPSRALKEVQAALEQAIEACYEYRQPSTDTSEPTTVVTDTLHGPVLIIDGLDFLIASQPDTTAAALSQMLLSIRQRVHSTILTVSSDRPLLHANSGPIIPLEREHQALIVTLAHQSQLIMQLRGLDTGTATDVSGVIRVSHGGGDEDEIDGHSLVEGEWLYKVFGDGTVRVWGRGD